jgi:hypothetical protein
MIQERRMGEWKVVYQDEVEGRWVTLKVYESENDEDGEDAPVVRVTVAPCKTWSRMKTGTSPL